VQTVIAREIYQLVVVETEQTASANLNVSRRMVLLLSLLKRHDRADLARGAEPTTSASNKTTVPPTCEPTTSKPKPHGPYLSIIAKHARWTRVSNLPQIPSRACAGMEDLSRINNRLVVHHVGSCSTMTDRQHSAATSLRSSQPRRSSEGRLRIGSCVTRTRRIDTCVVLGLM
jgi:hypothetical protein